MPIVIDKRVMHGKPVIKGTRIPVNVVVGSLAGGMTYEEVCQEYGITKRDVLDCLKYATQSLGSPSKLLSKQGFKAKGNVCDI